MNKYLDPAGKVGKIEEVTFAHVAVSGDPPRGARWLTFAELIHDLFDRTLDVEPLAIRSDA